LQPSVAGTVQGLLFAALLAGGTGAAMALNRPSTSVAFAVAAIAVVAARAAWQATRAIAVLDRAVARVASAAGLIPLPSTAPTPVVRQSAETTFSG
ncbi:MAG: hypothetical protein AB7F99_02550, partial [Vicinamibacterales bacterium]